MAPDLCMLVTKGYKHSFGICNTYCFSTTTVVSRTRLNVTFLLNIACPVISYTTQVSATQRLGTQRCLLQILLPPHHYCYQCLLQFHRFVLQTVSIIQRLSPPGCCRLLKWPSPGSAVQLICRIGVAWCLLQPCIFTSQQAPMNAEDK